MFSGWFSTSCGKAVCINPFSTHSYESREVFHISMCKTLWITVENIIKTVENSVDSKSFPLFCVEKYVDSHKHIHIMRKTKKE
jgi:hypothetical protein